VKFPKRLRHRGRGRVLATIYKRPDGYRLYWRARVDGKRRSLMKDFPSYSEAKREGDKVVASIAKDSQVAVLSPGQANDALAALERLRAFYQKTGRTVSLRSAVADFADASEKLHGRTLGEAVEGYLRNVASVKRLDIAEAVEKFITGEEPRTKTSDGTRPEINPKYHYDRAIKLRRFAATFPNTAVCDLAKEHLDAFVGGLAKLKSKSNNRRPVSSAKSRNHNRAAVKQFLQWAVRNDYLPATHRLLEADAMRPERGNGGEVCFYTPKEFRILLETADDTMRPLLAIGGLAGLRTSELLSLDWSEIWRVRGHIEDTAGKAKTRQRRLVEICPALAAWLQPFRALKSGKLFAHHEITFQQNFVALCEKAGVTRKPNALRHSFCTYHFAANANENLTAQQAGNSPQMIHAHYKGLATKAEAKKWFALRPAKSAKNVILMPATANR
jgi:integrase